MKSKTLIFLAIISISGLPASVLAAVPAPKSATSTADAKKTAKAQDPLVALIETLSSSITQVNANIDTLEAAGADVNAAQKFIENARSGLNSVKISLAAPIIVLSAPATTLDAATTSATTTLPLLIISVSATSTATTTAAVSPKTRDEVRKEAKDDLIAVYKNILAAIAALKKSIVVERVRLEIPYESNSSASIAPAASAAPAAN
jgi:biotin operon repressor